MKKTGEQKVTAQNADTENMEIQNMETQNMETQNIKTQNMKTQATGTNHRNFRQISTQKLTQIVDPLLAWFDRNARILPWRENPLPYNVWVSEIMLQQTRVEAVKPFFARFTEALPDVQALAQCPEDRLLKLWEGLGYYNRVRNMQKAARVVVEQYGGRIPDRYEELIKLPGIGSYTAGAVASIAYGRAVPAVDGNVLRVISRISGYDGDIMKQSVRREFEKSLQEIMPEESQQPYGRAPGCRNHPGAFNQALMELGATVCVPNGMPDCGRCPVSMFCSAKEQGCQMELPVKASKKERRVEIKTVFVIRDSGHAAVRKRPSGGLLAGLYELPNVEGHLSSEEALEQVKRYGFTPLRIWPLAPAKHIFSHVEWQMTGYMAEVGDWGERSRADMGDILFVDPERTEREYPIPAAFAAYASYLSIRLGQDRYTED